MQPVYKLVKLASKVEANLTNLQKLKLARKRLIRVANLEDPKKFTAVTKDMSRETSKQVDDKEFKKNQKEVNTEETPNK